MRRAPEPLGAPTSPAVDLAQWSVTGLDPVPPGSMIVDDAYGPRESRLRAVTGTSVSRSLRVAASL